MGRSSYPGHAVEDYSVDYNAEPTLALFHRSNAFIRGVRGPVGSGKSVGCGPIEILYRAAMQEPDKYGKRKTRFACVRNTYGELRTTTIKTFQEWIPNEVAPIKWDEPICATMIRPLGDGTTIECEVYFIAVDKPAQVKKLKSFELTGVWLNEASEFDKSILDMASSRVGRYPAKKDGAPLTWCGVIMDTNSMDDDHWWYLLAEGSDDPEEQEEANAMLEGLATALKELGMERPLMEFWEQPAALLEAQGSLVPNPDAENVVNQQLGFAYWLQLAAGKGQDFIDMYIMNKYGKVIDGIPVYNKDYSEAFHGRKVTLRPIPGLPITIGLDFGLSPAAVPMQVSNKGQLLILGECVAKERSMGFTRFYGDALKPYLNNRFGTHDANGQPWKFVPVGDPMGNQRGQHDEGFVFKTADELNFSITPAKTNATMARVESLRWFMNRNYGGEPAILIDVSAKMVRKGLARGYHYRRVQVTGEARYQNEPYKNKYSHPVEAAQYGALEYVEVASPAYGSAGVPDWAKKLTTNSHGAERPWKSRGAFSSRRVH